MQDLVKTSSLSSKSVDDNTHDRNLADMSSPQRSKRVFISQQVVVKTAVFLLALGAAFYAGGHYPHAALLPPPPPPPPSECPPTLPSPCPPCDAKSNTEHLPQPSGPTLNSIGMSMHSDKVTVHRYDIPYQLHFEPLRNKPLKILEIGLGCIGLKDIGLGIRLWGTYFGAAKMDVIEYNAKCVTQFEGSGRMKKWGVHARVHVGDQSDVAFLTALGEKEGPWDIIIDDGSHESAHQMLSYNTLLPYVKNGGKYVIEDLQTSFWGGKWASEGTAYRWIGLDVLRSVQTRKKIGKDNEALDSKFKSPLQSVDCHHYMCVMTKR